MISYWIPGPHEQSIDRVMFMYDGRIVKELKKEDATEEEILKYAFGHGEEQAVA